MSRPGGRRGKKSRVAGRKQRHLPGSRAAEKEARRKAYQASKKRGKKRGK